MRFILYASNTSEIAAAAVVDIVNYIRSDNFRQVFGIPIFTTERDNMGFYVFRITVPCGPNGQYIEKNCIVKSIGTGKQVRGMLIDNQRPQLLVADDVENDENIGTEHLQRKTDNWLMGPFFKAADKKWSKFIFIGNMLSNKCFLYRITLLDDWASRRIGCIKADGTPLWPELWPLEELRMDFLNYQKLGHIGQWFCEMMNMPVSEADGLIASSHIKFREEIIPGEQEAAFITVDPAISEKTWADKTAIVVHVLYQSVWQIAEYIEDRMQPDRIFAILLELCRKWGIRVVGIEMAGYQRALKVLFDLMMAISNDFTFDVYEIPHRNRPKVERLVQWCSMLREGLYYLNNGEFAVVEQLLAYDPTKKNNVDDLIDSCSMGPTMVTMYLPQIMTKYDVVPANDLIRTGYKLMQY